MIKNLLNYGKRDRHLETFILVFTTLFISIIYIISTEILSNPQSVEQVTSSGIFSDEILAIFRTSCSILCVITLFWVAYDPKGSPDYPLYYHERINRHRHSSGITRLAAFTMWHFGLIGISFTISAMCSWIHIFGGEIPEWMLTASPILFSTSFTCAILVTCIVTFHIIGTEMRRGNNIDHLFYWYEIVMHNLNVIILSFAIIINNFDIYWNYAIFPVLFCLIYILWARIYANIAGVYIYNFIDPRLNGAPIIHIILLLMIIIIFLIVTFIHWLVNYNLLISIIVILFLTNYIIKIKNPNKVVPP